MPRIDLPPAKWISDVDVAPNCMKQLSFSTSGVPTKELADALSNQYGMPVKLENNKLIVEGEFGKLDLVEEFGVGKNLDAAALDLKLRDVLSEGQYKVFSDVSNKTLADGGFPTREQAARLETRSNEQVEQARQDVNNPMTNGTLDSMKKAMNQALSDMYAGAKEAFKDNYKVLAKYALIGGLSYEVLQKMASANNGCYLVNKDTGARVKKVGGESWADPAVCVCSGKAPAAVPPTGVTDNACYGQCAEQAAADPSNRYVINWPLCSTMCACSKYYKDKPADQQYVLASPQYELQVVKTDIWGVLSSFVSTVGMYVERITDSVISIVESTADAFSSFMKNAGWYIVGAIAVVIVIVIILAVVDASKKKQGGAGIFPQKGGTRELKGGYVDSHLSSLLFPYN